MLSVFVSNLQFLFPVFCVVTSSYCSSCFTLPRFAFFFFLLLLSVIELSSSSWIHFSCANNLRLFLWVHINYLIMHFVQIFHLFLFIDFDFELGSLNPWWSSAGIAGRCHTFFFYQFFMEYYLFSFVSFLLWILLRFLSGYCLFLFFILLKVLSE